MCTTQALKGLGHGTPPAVLVHVSALIYPPASDVCRRHSRLQRTVRTSARGLPGTTSQTSGSVPSRAAGRCGITISQASDHYQ